jgi:hypothetical protein
LAAVAAAAKRLQLTGLHEMNQHSRFSLHVLREAAINDAVMFPVYYFSSIHQFRLIFLSGKSSSLAFFSPVT